jgi:hypothetical protein
MQGALSISQVKPSDVKASLAALATFEIMGHSLDGGEAATQGALNVVRNLEKLLQGLDVFRPAGAHEATLEVVRSPEFRKIYDALQGYDSKKTERSPDFAVSIVMKTYGVALQWQNPVSYPVVDPDRNAWLSAFFCFEEQQSSGRVLRHCPKRYETDFLKLARLANNYKRLGRLNEARVTQEKAYACLQQNFYLQEQISLLLDHARHALHLGLGNVQHRFILQKAERTIEEFSDSYAAVRNLVQILWVYFEAQDEMSGELCISLKLKIKKFSSPRKKFEAFLQVMDSYFEKEHLLSIADAVQFISEIMALTEETIPDIAAEKDRLQAFRIYKTRKEIWERLIDQPRSRDD